MSNSKTHTEMKNSNLIKIGDLLAIVFLSKQNVIIVGCKLNWVQACAVLRGLENKDRLVTVINEGPNLKDLRLID